MIMKKRIPYSTKLPVKLTLQERDLIQNETLCSPDCDRFAVIEGKGVILNLSLDHIEGTQGYIATEANHTKSGKLQKNLDRLFSKFQVYLGHV
jgi:hypothetical protein